MARTVRKPPAVVDHPVLRHVLRRARALPTRSMIHRRMWILPSSTIAFIRSTSAKDDPASWNEVMPFESTSFDGELEDLPRARAALFGASASRRCRCWIRRDAVSRNSPVGLPVASLRKSPPGGFAVLPRDAGQLHRLGVGEAGVAAGVRQQDRIVRRHLARATRASGKPSTFGPTARVPLLLVPAAAVDPLARLRGLHLLGHHRDDLVPGSRVHQVQIQLRRADAGEVTVPLDEAGDHQLPLDVDDLGLRPDVLLDVGVDADGDDPSAADGDRLRLGRAVLDGDDLAVGDDQVGDRRDRRAAAAPPRALARHAEGERGESRR